MYLVMFYPYIKLNKKEQRFVKFKTFVIVLRVAKQRILLQENICSEIFRIYTLHNTNLLRFRNGARKS